MVLGYRVSLAFGLKQLGGIVRSGNPGAMPPKERAKQPSHLSSDDALKALQESYCGELLDSFLEGASKGKLPFQHVENEQRQDRNALYVYRDVVKAFAKLNPTGK